MDPSLGSRITKAASRQTYYTIRWLVDRPMVEDAFRAYAYFRWLDDLLDGDDPKGGPAGSAGPARLARERLLDREIDLLERCLRGNTPSVSDPHEAMLVELVRDARDPGDGLGAYLRHMMRVMELDVRRRGRLVSEIELDDYTRSLSIAVTEAMDHFIGHGDATPQDETRYLAVRGAHILHMLRDTFDDLAAGYYNCPREVLEAGSIEPADVLSAPYRAWVASRIALAGVDLEAGRDYFARVPSPRHRLAGLAYIARFEWLIETLKRDGYRLRHEYRERGSSSTVLRMGWRTIAAFGGHRARSRNGARIASSPRGRP